MLSPGPIYVIGIRAIWDHPKGILGCHIDHVLHIIVNHFRSLGARWEFVDRSEILLAQWQLLVLDGVSCRFCFSCYLKSPLLPFPERLPMWSHTVLGTPGPLIHTMSPSRMRLHGQCWQFWDLQLLCPQEQLPTGRLSLGPQGPPLEPVPTSTPVWPGIPREAC